VNITQAIEEFTANRKPNLPRILNAGLRSVISNAQMSSSNAAASIVFLTGRSSAVDVFRQFPKPIYVISLGWIGNRWEAKTLMIA
jgi:hypothetical protein